MNLDKFIKKLILPQNFSVPDKLDYQNLTAKPLTRQDLKPDLEAVNSSRELIRKTRGPSWPVKDIDEDTDFLDLAWHEREFNHGISFAYVVYSSEGEYTGCFYLYPMGARTNLSEKLNDYDVDVSWWVTNEAYKNGEYEKLFQAIKNWIASSFPFEKPYFSNKEIPNENN